MKCTDCKHGIPKKGKVTVTFDRESTTVVIKDVPALVCPVCGAWYLNSAMTKKVLEIGNKAVLNGEDVEVFHLKAA